MLFDDSEIILHADKLSKRFRLGQFVGLVPLIRTFKGFLTDPLEYWRSRKTSSKLHSHVVIEGDRRYLWAVRDVSLSLKRGEKVAVLGRNGAGKSTLLKMITKIMVPTEGDIFCKARVVPLMGVGSGFNPELTGKENVFTYAALLGVSPTETRQLYDDIVAFSEIPEFMDTPLKRYSKGMRARLGMAVALNLKPELLVVDEVLAVGDIRFRAKCMEKMEAMCNSGMTLLFVSHSPARVKALCERSILIRDGVLIDDGDTQSVLQRYLEEDIGYGKVDTLIDDESVSNPRHNYLSRIEWELEYAPGNEIVQITEVRITDHEGEERQSFNIDEPIHLEMTYRVFDDKRSLRPRFQIFDENLNFIFATIDTETPWLAAERDCGMYKSVAIIPGNLLGAHTFVVGAGVFSHQPLEKHAITGEVVSFSISEITKLKSAQSDYCRPLLGYFRPLLVWNTTRLDKEN